MSDNVREKQLDIRRQKRARRNSPVLLERIVEGRLSDPYNYICQENLSTQVGTSQQRVASIRRRIGNMKIILTIYYEKTHYVKLL